MKEKLAEDVADIIVLELISSNVINEPNLSKRTNDHHLPL